MSCVLADVCTPWVSVIVIYDNKIEWAARLKSWFHPYSVMSRRSSASFRFLIASRLLSASRRNLWSRSSAAFLSASVKGGAPLRNASLLLSVLQSWPLSLKDNKRLECCITNKERKYLCALYYLYFLEMYIETSIGLWWSFLSW